MLKISGAVLTGGESRRMGRDKSFLKYDNQTFIEKLLEQLSVCDEILISVRDKSKYLQFDYLLVEDLISGIGAIGGIYSCLKTCKNDYLFVCATDMPLLESKLINFIVEFISGDYDCFVIKSTTKIQPLCAIYHKNCLPVIEKMIENGSYRLMDLLGCLKVKHIPLAYSCFEDKLVSNINNVQAYSELMKPAVMCVSGVKNSGKTTLITKVIKALKAEGYQVAIIKHDGHDFEVDLPSTDTYRHRIAGSNPTIIYSDTKWAMIKKEKAEIEELIAKVSDADLIIIEGLKKSHYPKIEVVRKVNGLQQVCDTKNLLAVASDEIFDVGSVRAVDINDIEEMIAIIKREVLSSE